MNKIYHQKYNLKIPKNKALRGIQVIAKLLNPEELITDFSMMGTVFNHRLRIGEELEVEVIVREGG